MRRHWIHVIAGLTTTAVIIYLAPAQLIWLSPILVGLVLAPLTSRWSASPIFGRWARAAGLLVTPEERNIPSIMAASVTEARHLRVPPDVMVEIGRNEAARNDYIALIPPTEPRPVNEQLSDISAKAKISVASSQAEALLFLNRDELYALLNSPDLINQWSELSL